MAKKRTSYGDQPTTRDELGFTASINALASLVKEAELEDTPITIGVFGPWGSGKTSFMEMLLAQLKTDNADFVPIWFDAWRYAQDESLWRAFLVCIVEGLRRQLVEQEAVLNAMFTDKGTPSIEAIEKARVDIENELDELLTSLYRNIERDELGGIEIDWGKATASGMRLAMRVGLSFIPILSTITKVAEAAQEKLGEGEDIKELIQSFQRERSKVYRDQVKSLDQFQDRLRDLVQKWISGRGRRLVVFIDDLDRCLPEQAVGLLEAIKIFLDIRGCIFILGVDREIIERGIYVHYKDFLLATKTANLEGIPFLGLPIDGRDYLDKIVQVPFELPPLENIVIRRFLEKRLKNIDLPDQKMPSSIALIMSTGLIPNPRKIKRSFNTFRLLLALSDSQHLSVPPEHLSKMIVIQNSYPLIYERAVQDPMVLCIIEKMARNQSQDYSSIALAMSIFAGNSPLHMRLRTIYDELSIDEDRQNDQNSDSKAESPKRGHLPIPSQLIRDIFAQNAPRLRHMLEIEPSFSLLDRKTLERLVFLTQTTQSWTKIEQETVASRGNTRLVATKYRLED